MHGCNTQMRGDTSESMSTTKAFLKSRLNRMRQPVFKILQQQSAQHEHLTEARPD